MSETKFVGRQTELAQLDVVLQRAVERQGQVVFVTGEAGSGKTALMQEFARRSQTQRHDLIVAVGDCNAQTGTGEAFLPFREVLGQLTGDLDAKLAQGRITPQNADRVQRLLAKSGLIMLDVAYDLVDTLVPGGKFIATAGKALSKQSGLQEKLEKLGDRRRFKTDLSPASLDQDHIFEQYTNFLRTLSADVPLLIVLDDLQWADSSSLSLLFHLGRRLEKMAVMIVGCYRPDEVAWGREGQRHPLEKVQAELTRYLGDIVIEVGAGNGDAKRAFVDAYLDAEPNRLRESFRQALTDSTGGNPLFLGELLQHLRERGDLLLDAEGQWVENPIISAALLPARIEGVFAERLSRLQQDLRQTLTMASVEGAHFTAEIVARLQSATDRDLVLRLSNDLSKLHRLVDAVGTERVGARRLSHYQFHHKLLRNYLYDGLDAIERAYLHESIGELLEELYSTRLDEVAVQLAWHFSEAEIDDKAAKYLRRAGELAAAVFAHDEATKHFSRALELAPADDLAMRFDILLARVTVHNWQGQRNAESQDLQTLAELAAKMKDMPRMAEVSLRQANHARLTGNYDSALAFIEQALAQAGAGSTGGDPIFESRVYALWGQILLHKGAYDEARDWLELAMVAVEDGGPPDLLAQIVHNLGLMHYYQDRFQEAQVAFEKARALYHELANRRGEIICLIMFGAMAHRQSHFASAQAYYEQALSLSRASGWRYQEEVILGNLGTLLFDLGDYESADAYHKQAQVICEEIGDREGQAISLDMLGMMAHYLGDIDAARKLFQQGLAIQREIGYRRGEGYTLTHLGHALVDAGDLNEARKVFEQALAIRRAIDENSGGAVDDLAGLARAALAAGDLAQALDYAQQAYVWMETKGSTQVEYPVQAYLICHKVAQRAAKTLPVASTLAHTCLERGYALIEQRAAAIEDARLRQTFLENVPFNREISAIWRQTRAE